MHTYAFRVFTHLFHSRALVSSRLRGVSRILVFFCYISSFRLFAPSIPAQLWMGGFSRSHDSSCSFPHLSFVQITGTIIQCLVLIEYFYYDNIFSIYLNLK